MKPNFMVTLSLLHQDSTSKWCHLFLTAVLGYHCWDETPQKPQAGEEGGDLAYAFASLFITEGIRTRIQTGWILEAGAEPEAMEKCTYRLVPAGLFNLVLL